MASFSTMEYLGHHPIVGAVIMVGHIVIAAAIPCLDMEIPTIVMQLFQLSAWSVAMLAGTFTIYGVWKTHHGRKGKK